MKLKILMIALVFGLSMRGHATISMTPNGTFMVCPSEWITYQISNSINTICSYEITALNGEIEFGFLNGNTSTLSGSKGADFTIRVKWFSGSNGGSLTISAVSCLNSSGVATGGGLIPIKSLANVTPSGISGDNSIAVNATSNQPYSIAAINYPNPGPGDPNPFAVGVYEWELPSGWTVVSGGITRSITVTPDNCTGGVLRVRGKNTTCSAGPFYTSWSEIIVARTIATPGTITGATTLDCLDTSVRNYSLSAVSGATSYSWTLPSGWTGSSSTTSIDVTPSGTTFGTISVKANACSTQSQPSSLNIGVAPAGGSINGPTEVCSSGTTFTLSNLPGGASAVWTASANININSSTGYAVPAGLGSGWVTATISYPCGSSYPITTSIYNVGLYGSVSSGISYIAVNSTGDFGATALCGPGPYQYDWFIKNETENLGEAYLIASGENITLKSVSTPSLPSVTSRSFSLYVRITDNGGATYYTGLYYTSTKLRGNLIDATIAPLMANQDEKNFALYPNPASSYFEITSAVKSRNYKVKLFNAEGKLVYEEDFKKPTMRISTTRFLPGAYIAHIIVDDATELHHVRIE